MGVGDFLYMTDSLKATCLYVPMIPTETSSILADLSGIIQRRTRQKHEFLKPQPAFVHQVPIDKPVTTFSDSWKGSLCISQQNTTHKKDVLLTQNASTFSTCQSRITCLSKITIFIYVRSDSKHHFRQRVLPPYKINYSSAPIISTEFTGSKFYSFFRAMNRDMVGMCCGYKQH